MKGIILLIIIVPLLLTCKKTSDRKCIDIDLISIDGETPENESTFNLDYTKNHEIGFPYESDYELDIIYIRYTTNTHKRLDGIDEERISPVPNQGSKIGSFIYAVKSAL